MIVLRVDLSDSRIQYDAEYNGNHGYGLIHDKNQVVASGER
jgi:hypothetical protein